MEKIELKEWYAHEHSPSVFVMFRKNQEIVWSYSGNELRRVYLTNPDEFISEPLELPIPEYLDRILTEFMNNY